MPAAPFLQAKRPEIRDVNETILFTFSNIDERSIDSRQNVFNSAEINISDLIATLGNDQFINAFIVSTAAIRSCSAMTICWGMDEQRGAPQGSESDRRPTAIRIGVNKRMRWSLKWCGVETPLKPGHFDERTAIRGV